MNPDLLLDRLRVKGLLSAAQIAMVTGSSANRSKPIEQILTEEGMLSEAAVMEVMSEVYGIPFRRLEPSILDVDQAAQFPHQLLETYCVFPLKREGGSEVLQMATADPFDISALDLFRHITGLRVEPVLATRAEIRGAISGELLGGAGLQLMAQQVPMDFALERLQSTSVEELESEHSTPIIQLVSSIITSAVRCRASDIHFEPLEECVRVRYRIDGILQTIVELPIRIARACVCRMKIISNLDISESRKPQDGRTGLRLEDAQVDMRVSTLPTLWGEKVVLRILDRTGRPPSLEELGLLEHDLAQLRSYLRSSHGMILITGPTGSGKTSTLYAALDLLNEPSVNIATVEDPVEYQMAGVSQVAVNARAGLTFATALRSFLRQDPDILMIGEVRDLETAEIAVQAAQTGHLVFSTLHTNDAPSALERLILMGLEAHMAAGSLLCVVAQRLVRRLCPTCRVPTALTEEQGRLLAMAYERPTISKMWTAEGCETCDGTGYRGRLGLFEILPVTARIRQQMLEDPAEERLWHVGRREGMVTLLEDGVSKVEAGLTSLDEVLRVVTIKRAKESEHYPEESRLARSTRTVVETLPPLRVVDVMTPGVHTVRTTTRVCELTQILLEKGISGTVVVDADQRPVGVVSFNDIAVYTQAPGTVSEELTAEEIMSRWVIKIHPCSPLRRAVQLFRRHKVHRLVVAQGPELLGVVTPLDVVIRGRELYSGPLRLEASGN